MQSQYLKNLRLILKNNNISRKNRLKSKKQAPANYLIVCEGKKTEPNYFNGLKKEIQIMN